MDQNQTPGSVPPTDGTPPPAGTPPTDPVTAGVPPVPTDTPSTPPATPDVPPVPPATPETPAVPPATPETPAVPPVTPPTETPPAPTETPSAETPSPTETPPPPTEAAPPAADPAAPASAPTDSGTPASDAPKDPTAPASATPPEGGKKGPSKPIMVTLGLLVVGALSAVFLVSNMKPGDTQSSASVPTRPPSVPTMATQSSPAAMTADPHLVISSPTPNSTVTTPVIVVSGKTFPNAEISVGEKDLKADPTGNFSTSVTLDEGENIISLTANDENGNAAEQEITVTYEAE